MEKISIQPDEKYICEVEHFIDTVCGQMNVHNYAATISMSLMAAIKKAIAATPKDNNADGIVVACDHCQGGICFSVSAEGLPYAPLNFQTPGSSLYGFDTDFFLMQSLTDRMEILDEGRTLKLVYLINGIRTSRAMERKLILQNYFAPKLVHA